MRLQIAAGEQKSLTGPIILKSVLIDTDGTNDAVLTIVDANGDVTPVNGFKVRGNSEHGGFMQLNEPCEPSIVVELTGTGATATVYYEEIQWKDVLKLLRVFSF